MSVALLRAVPRSPAAHPTSRDIASEVLAAADARDGGIRVVRIDTRSAPIDKRVVTALEQRGFVIVSPAEWEPSAHNGALLHRHVVLGAKRPGDRAQTIRWIRELAAASPRLHIVIWPFDLTVFVDDEWRRHVERICRCATDYVERNWSDRAEALIRGVEAEAAVRGVPCPARALEMRGLIERSRAQYVERTPMEPVERIGNLVEMMEQAQDGPAALTAGCAWVRRQAPDARIIVTSSDGTRLLASAGWRQSELAGSLCRIFVSSRPEGGATAETPCDVRIPVRYGGATVGHIILSGGCQQAAQCARAFAMLAGSAVRCASDSLDIRLQERDSLPEILGRSLAIVEVRTALTRAAATSFPVLIEGESGTGKELAARALHKLSVRRDRPFLAVNCAALTDDLVEAELFGHARGAFTGAIGPRPGLFEEAHGGSLFLDEVGELSPRAQAKLLRVLQEREVRRVGENSTRPVDVRIIAATNLPLRHAVAVSRFRDDLRFRLAVVGVRLPALRDRLEDMPLLTHVFWRRALAETGKRAVLGPDALARLARHHWPGNVRELQNVIAGLAVTAPVAGRVTARHVEQVLAQNCGTEPDQSLVAVPLEAARRIFERRHVAATLIRHAGKRSAAAHELGLTRQGLAKTMRRLGLADEDMAGVA